MDISSFSDKVYSFLLSKAIYDCGAFHGQTMFVMLQGLAQTFLVRLPVSCFMSIQEKASLTGIGLAAPSAAVFGILINGSFFIYCVKRKYRGENG